MRLDFKVWIFGECFKGLRNEFHNSVGRHKGEGTWTN